MENFNTQYIINIIQFHWKKFTIIAVIAIIISSFLSSPLFIKPTYKSSAVIYPTNLTRFSEESPTEQLLQFINSEEVKIAMTKRFNLFKVYEIDTLSVRAHSKFDLYYSENIKATSTLYESIEIDVIDESPKLAQQMANALIEETNKLVDRSKKSKNEEYLVSYQNQLTIMKAEIDSIENKLKSYRVNYGILDFKSQSKIMSKRVGEKALSEEEKLLLKGLKEIGGDYTILQEELKGNLKNYKMMKLDYDKNRMNYNGKLSYSTIISKANLPDKKHAPQRAIIVLFFTLSVLLFSLIIILFTNKKQNNVAKN